MMIDAPVILATPELDRLGNEIAELSAHVDAATARLLTLICSKARPRSSAGSSRATR